MNKNRNENNKINVNKQNELNNGAIYTVVIMVIVELCQYILCIDKDICIYTCNFVC